MLLEGSKRNRKSFSVLGFKWLGQKTQQSFVGQKVAVQVVTTRWRKICSIEKFCCLQLVFIVIPAVKTPLYPHEIYILIPYSICFVVFHKVKLCCLLLE